jgi:hypothetical protein
MSDVEYTKMMATAIGQSLVGAVITQSVVAEDYSSFGFEARMPTGEIKTVWVLSDPEGNGAGYLDVES